MRVRAVRSGSGVFMPPFIYIWFTRDRVPYFQGYVPVWVQLAYEKPFIFFSFAVFSDGADKTGNRHRLGGDQGIYMAVGRLSI